MLKVKRKRYSELLDGVNKRDSAARDEEAFRAQMRELDNIDPIDKTSDTDETETELKRLKDGHNDPELALIDALVLSEVTARSCKDVTALAR